MPLSFLPRKKFSPDVYALLAALLGLNALIWAVAWQSFAATPVLLGTALLAWVFGLRHAVDADHIAAIDNTVRHFMQNGQRPYTAGLWFSLGHSTVVVLACMLIAAAARQFQHHLDDMRLVGSVIGTFTSAAFLLAVALANLTILLSLWRQFRTRQHHDTNQMLETILNDRGLLARLYRPLFARITRPRHLYPLGFLFGLGFDTATEVGLLGISASQSTAGIPAWQIMIFPALFTAGMTLVDTLDSTLMVGAYHWAFVHPLRKLWYNMTMTAISIAVAVLIGTIEALGMIGERLHLSGSIWSIAASLNGDLADFGFLILGVFIGLWALSALIYRLTGLDAPSRENAGQSGS